MDSGTLSVIVTCFLVIVTVVYTLITRDILKQQRRIVEYQIKPIIRIKIKKRVIKCTVSRNDVFNLKMKVTINGISDEQNLGHVMIDLERSFTHSKDFSL